MKISRENGVSLVEVIFALGIVGVIGLAVMRLTQMNIKSANVYESKSDSISLVNEIRALLSDENACEKSFGGGGVKASHPGSVVTEIKNANGITSYNTGKSFGKIKIIEMKFNDNFPEVNVIPGGIGDTYLEITLDRGDTFGAQNITKRVRVRVETDMGGNIDACSASVSQGSSPWRKSTIVDTNLFYNEGYVGVGTEDPSFTLDINDVQSKLGRFLSDKKSTVEIETSDDANGNTLLSLKTPSQKWNISNSSVNGKSWENGFAIKNATSGTTPFYIDESNGNIGVGTTTPRAKLDVKGNIKLGSDSTCDAPSKTEGSIRYNSTNKRLEFCDGTSWIATGADAIKAVYPVGSIYINATSNTNPNTLLGFGTWASIGAGKVLVGVDSTQAEFDTHGKTGGEKEVTLSVNQMPAHTHKLNEGNFDGDGEGTFVDGLATSGGGADPVTTSTGGGLPHNNLQPYITVYMWVRTL